MQREFSEQLLAIAVERRGALAALAREPHHREELETELDVSKTTCHRIIRTFDDRGLLGRTDSGYVLTPLGELLSDLVGEFESSARLAYRLEPLVTQLDEAGIEFELDQFREATITEPEPGDPYPFADRTMELFRDSETIRVIDCNPLVPPVYVEKMLEIALDTGMRGEFVVTPEIALGNMQEFPELQRQVAESEDTAGNYLVTEDIEFGMALYDSHLDLRVYDEETGTPVLCVDTDDPAAIEWGESLYKRYRERADPTSSLDEYPDWAPDTPFEPPTFTR